MISIFYKFYNYKIIIIINQIIIIINHYNPSIIYNTNNTS